MNQIEKLYKNNSNIRTASTTYIFNYDLCHMLTLSVDDLVYE